MARRRRGPLSRLGGGVPAVGELFNIVRELSFDELRDEAQLPPRLLLAGADAAGLLALRDALGGAEAASFIETATFDDLPRNLDGYDGIVLVNATPADRARPQIRQLLSGAETAGRTLTFQLPPTAVRQERPTPPPAAAVDDLRQRLITRLAHRQLALGRYLPAFRRDAAQSVINQTARANAEFALLSNIPAVIPIVGNLMAVGADFLVLTKNQMMLIYKMAAIHGRDIQHPWQLYTELLPTVGAGILWRTIARELAALVPFAGGTIPKVLIAYAGTAATGQAASFFYEQGKRPSRDQMRSFYARALDLARGLRLGGGERDGDRGGNVIEGRFTETSSQQATGPTVSTNGPTTAGTGTTGPAPRPPGEQHAGQSK